MIRGAWNDNHAHKILTYNLIKIMRYRAFNLEKFRLSIGFHSLHHSPQLCRIIHSYIVNVRGQP